MDQGPRDLEENGSIAESHRWWGLRPWKRHSTILMVVGLLYALIGVNYALGTPNPNRERALVVLVLVAPMQFWGWVFVGAGLMTMLSAKWPPMTETWGYMVLTGLSSGWAATYLTSIIFFHAPWSNTSQVAVWGILAFIWWAISGLPNPEKIAVRPNERE